MRVLVVGAGGVGAAVARVAARRGFLTALVLADVDRDRAGRAAAATGSDRVSATRADASDPAAVAELIGATRAEAVLNACDPRHRGSHPAGAQDQHPHRASGLHGSEERTRSVPMNLHFEASHTTETLA